MIPGIAAPWMLPWLAVATLPPLLAWLALRHTRSVRFGPIDLVRAAARRARLTSGGVDWPRALVRCLLLAAAATAAARPFLESAGRPAPGLGATRLVDGAADRSIVIVAAGAGDVAADAALALERAVEALVTAIPRGDVAQGAPLPPTVDRVPLGAIAPGDDGRPPGRRLAILADGVVPGPGDAGRIRAAVDRGLSLLVCLGPSSLDAAIRPRLTDWLAPLGITVEGVVRLDDAAIAVAADLARPLGLPASTADRDDGAARLPGPTVTAAAALRMEQGDVLARTIPGNLPLICVARRGRGLVAVSALPLALAARHLAGEAAGGDGTANAFADDAERLPEATWSPEAAWSDLAAWPVFVPLVDRLIERLVPDWRAGRGDAGRPAATGTGTERVRLPLAPALIAVAILLAIADGLLAAAPADEPARSRFWPHASGRAAMLAVLVGMMLAWCGLSPPDVPAAAEAAVAFVVDVSPSMAGPVEMPAGDTPAGNTASRLDAVRDAVRDAEQRGGGRLVRGWQTRLFAAADGITAIDDDTSLGAALGPIAAAPPAHEGTRLGSGLTRLLDPAPDGGERPPAAIVVFSDGVITAGASWGEVARAAAARRVPLVAVPVRAGSDGHPPGLPAGFRYTAVAAPRLCRSDAPIEMLLEAEAAGGLSPVRVRAWADWPAAGPPLAESTLAWQPVGPTEQPRLAGRLVVPPRALAGDGSRCHSLVIVAGDDPNGAPGAATTAPLAVTDEPLRVLFVESSPRFEWRFLERLLAADPAFAGETALTGAAATAALRHLVPLPDDRAGWNTHDVVVIGDVPLDAVTDPAVRGTGGAGGVAGDAAAAIALPGLEQAAHEDGVGIAWLPGRRWQDHAAAGPDWLPARLGAGADLAASSPRRLRAVGGGRATTWLPVAAGAGPIEPEAYAIRGPLILGPTARTIATAPLATDAAPAAAGPPAIVVDRLGAAQMLAVFCDTWRWRQADFRAWSDFWRRSLARLGEPHLLAHVFPATIDVEPPAVVAGDAVRITLSPTHATTDLRGWSLVLTAATPFASPADPGTRVRTIGPADTVGPGRAAVIELTDLPAGIHEMRLVAPATDARPAAALATPPHGGTPAAPPAAGVVAHRLLVMPMPVEQPGGPAATTALEAAARTSGGAVVPLDELDSLPQVLGRLLDRTRPSGGSNARAAAPRRAAGPHHRLRDPLLLVALVAAAAAAWWPAADGRVYREPTYAHE